MFKLNPFQKRPPSADPSPQTQSGSKQKRIPRSPYYPFTTEGIRKRAQKIYEKRIEEGLEGTPEGDWKQAIKELKWERSLLAKFGRWTGLGQKKGWDLAQLLTSISIPVAIFAGSSLFTYWNNYQQQQIADDKSRQETFNKYLDQMAASLKDGLLKAPPGSETFTIAQARTITTLLSLDGKRQSLVIQFLSASGLNQAGRYSVDKNGHVQLGKDSRMLLYEARMAKVNFAESDLSGAVLIGADLSDANLSDANLSSAELRDANLSGAELSGAILYYAELSRALLYSADLSGATLYSAELNGAILGRANLSGADLSDAKNWTDDQLSQASFCNTILPEGSKLDPNRDCKELLSSDP